MPYRELKNAVEHHPAAPGRASVEAKNELIQVRLQMLVPNSALMRAQQPTLEERRDTMNAGQLDWEYLEQGPDVWRVRIGKV